MMRRRRFGGRPFRRGKQRDSLWSGDLSAAETLVAAGAGSFIQLVVPSDYQHSTGTVESGATTLARIRGSVSWRSTVVGGIAYFAIMVIDANEGPPNPANIAVFLRGDLLWHSVQMSLIDTTRNLEFDVKTKRRLENDQVVFLVGAIAQAVTYVMSGRCLLLGVH